MANGAPTQIRRVERHRPGDFDEQLWPINVAILILAGFVVGVTLVCSDFENLHPWYSNGWIRLTGIAISIAALFAGAMLLRGRNVRRVQLCVVLSLLLHLLFAMYLAHQYLGSYINVDEDEREETPVQEQYRRIVIPDYVLQDPQQENPLESIDEPIEHEALEHQEPDAVVNEVETPPTPIEQQPIEEITERPPQRQPEQPDPKEMRRVAVTAPRRADAASGVTASRSEFRDRPTPNPAATRPQVTQSPRAAKAVPEPETAQRTPTHQPVNIQHTQAPAAPATTRERPPTAHQMVQRAQPKEQVNNQPTTPSPTRTLLRPEEIARSEAATPAPRQVTTSPVEPTPVARADSVRQQTDVPKNQPQPETAPTPMRDTQAIATAKPRATVERPVQPDVAAAQHTTPTRDATTPTEPIRQPTEQVATQAPSRTTPAPVVMTRPAQSSRSTLPAPAAVANERPLAATRSPQPTAVATAPQTPQARPETPQPNTIARQTPNRPTPATTPQAVAATQPIAQPARPTTPTSTAERMVTPQATQAARTAATNPTQVTQQATREPTPTASQALAALAAQRPVPTSNTPSTPTTRTAPTRTRPAPANQALASRPAPNTPASAQPAATPQTFATGQATGSERDAATAPTQLAEHAIRPQSLANSQAVSAAAAQRSVTQAALTQPTPNVTAPTRPSQTPAATVGSQVASTAAPRAATGPTAQATSPQFSRATSAATNATSAPTTITQQATTAPTSDASRAVAAAAQTRSTSPHTTPTAAESPSPTSAPSRAASQPMANLAATGPSSTSIAPAATQTSAPAFTTRAATSAARSMAATPSQITQNQPASQTAPRMTSERQLPATAASPRQATSQAASTSALASRSPSSPSSPHREATGVQMPSSAIASDTAPAAAAASAGMMASASTHQATTAAVKTASATPPANPAAAGSAEMAVGAQLAVTQRGQQRSERSGESSLAAATSAARQIARSGDPASTIGTTAASDASTQAAPNIAAPNQGISGTPALMAQADSATAGGDIRPMEVTQETPGAGPSAENGTTGPVQTLAERAITRHEAVVYNTDAGGGTPRPAHTAGETEAPNINVQATQIAAATPGQKATNSDIPMTVQRSGSREAADGPTGSLVSQPQAGAPASMTATGATEMVATARRQEAGSAGSESLAETSSQTVTMRRSGPELDMPTLTADVDDVAAPGAAGVASSEGALPSTLAQAATSAVRESTANVSIDSTAAADGPTDAAAGSASAVALSGQARQTGDTTPSLAAAATAPATDRTATAVGDIASAVDANINAAEASSAMTGQEASLAALTQTDQNAAARQSTEMSIDGAAGEASTELTADPNSVATIARSGNEDDEDEDERRRRLAALARAGQSGPERAASDAATQLAVSTLHANAPQAVAAGSPNTDAMTAAAGSVRGEMTDVPPAGDIATMEASTNAPATEAGPAGTVTGTSRMAQPSGPTAIAAAGAKPDPTREPGMPTEATALAADTVYVEPGDAPASAPASQPSGSATDATALFALDNGSTRGETSSLSAVGDAGEATEAMPNSDAGPTGAITSTARTADTTGDAASTIGAVASADRSTTTPANALAGAAPAAVQAVATGPSGGASEAAPMATVDGSTQDAITPASTDLAGREVADEPVSDAVGPAVAAAGSQPRTTELDLASAGGGSVSEVSRETAQPVSLSTGAIGTELAGGPTGAADPAAKAVPTPTAGSSVSGSAPGPLASTVGGAATSPASVTDTAVASTGGAARAATPTADAGATGAQLAGPRRPSDAITTPATNIGSVAADIGPTSQAPSVDGIPGASDRTAEPVIADALGTVRGSAGIAGPIVDAPALAATDEIGPTASSLGTVAGSHRTTMSDETGPVPFAMRTGDGPRREFDQVGLQQGPIQIEAPATQIAGTPEVGAATDVPVALGADLPSHIAGGMPILIAAVPGVGGLSSELHSDIGLPTRRARPESEIIHQVNARFIDNRTGGTVMIPTRISDPADAYAHRKPGRRAQAQQLHGVKVGTEAVESGLDFLARHQFPDGHWSLHELPVGVKYDDPALGLMQSDTAATGLALLTYLGGGYDHINDKYRNVVRHGVEWLVKNQAENGDLFSNNGGSDYCLFYSHGIATIALCEAYGLTQDPSLREPARKAVQFIIDTQQPFDPDTGRGGGWRYRIDSSGRSTESDTSVTGWQLMALKSGQMAGFEVPQETFDQIETWLRTASVQNQTGLYVYNPFAKNTDAQRHGRLANRTMTAESMLMLMYMGHDRNEPGMAEGADFVLEQLPSLGDGTDMKRNSYYWYYASQAMFHMSGDYQEKWSTQFKQIADATQTKEGPAAGSWHPTKPVPDVWGQHGGRMLVTTLHLLMLELENEYRVLPLFQELGN